MNDEGNKVLTFIAVEWTVNQRVFTNCGRNEQELPPPELRTARTLSWMARAGEEERGYRQGPYVPVGGSIRDHWSSEPLVPVGASTGTNGGALVPVGGSNRDKRPLPSHAAPASHWTRD